MKYLLIGCIFWTSGCSLLPGRSESSGTNVGQVARTIVERDAEPAGPVTQTSSREEVLSLYENIVSRIGDSQRRYQVSRRIAELQMARAEARSAEGEVESYEHATAALTNLLADEHARQDEARIHYQLAQVHDLSGNPDGVLENLNRLIASEQVGEVHGEARFRRAEYFFSNGRFGEAAEDFDFVSSGPAGEYTVHARYMLGWARFKQGDIDLAIAPLTAVLQDLSEDNVIPATELAADTTRLLVLILDYLDGAATLSETMAGLGKPGWQIHLYQALGDWYQQKERFQDSVLTWHTFLAQNPWHAQAPLIFLQTIRTYQAAGFISEVPTRKREFVRLYNRRSEFYARHGAVIFDSYADEMLTYLNEIVTNAHADAQESGLPGDYLAAADWYELWLENFAGHPQQAEMNFLMAEALSDAGATVRALARYAIVVAEFPASKRVREAAYAVLLAEESLADAGDQRIEQRARASRVFVSRFADDPRAPAIQVNLAKLLFDDNQYETAAQAAEFALSRYADAGELKETALTISAHSRFSLEQYDLAAAGYRILVKHQPEMRERLLVTIYKQGETAERAGAAQDAIGHYLELGEIAPSSPVAIDAGYDVAALYESLGQHQQAIRQLQVFRRDHGEMPVARQIPLRLVGLYEQTGQLAEAARELRQIHQDTTTPMDARRQALYRAGELFIEAGDTAMAIESFREYAHNWPDPVDIRLEAMHHMDVLYQSTGELDKRAYWLHKKVATISPIREAVDDRQRYLAAEAAYVLALDQQRAFNRLELTLPLKRTLARKRVAMSKTIEAFALASSFGVADFVSAATYETGRVYQALSVSLMASEVPRGLNDMEKAQYEILLEEQAYPFEEQAITIHTNNIQRGWRATWDHWVDASLQQLALLSPGRFRRVERGGDYVSLLY